MNQVLSQSEVDALLAAVSDGDVSNSGGGGGGGGSGSVAAKGGGSSSGSGSVEEEKVVVTYDLTSQDRIIRGRLPQLEVIYEKFMRTFRVSLSSSTQDCLADFIQHRLFKIW